MKLSELCESERPREKLLERGCSSLSDAELLAILIRTGTTSDSAIELAHKLLLSANGKLTTLAGFSLAQLCSISGIKKGKAPGILAAFELGRRFMNASESGKGESVTSPDTIFRLMLPHLKGLDHEECWVLLLDHSMIPTAKLRMSKGGSESTVIEKKDIIREAIKHKAAYIILVHNHPDGNPMPSKGDIKMTKELEKAAKTMDLTLVDHVIVCDGSYYSFSEERITQAL